MDVLIGPRKNIEIFRCLNDKQYRFVHEYHVHLNAKRAAMATGTKNAASAAVVGHKMLKIAKVRRAIRYLEEKVVAECMLTAELVRHKIALVLTFKPSRYFRNGGNGGWYATQEQMDNLPDEIAELITEIQQKTTTTKDSKNVLYWVKFMSKDKSLELSVRITHAEKHRDDERLQINWDDLMSNSRNGLSRDDSIQKRIESVKKKGTTES